VGTSRRAHGGGRGNRLYAPTELSEELPGITGIAVDQILHPALVPDGPRGLVLLFYRVQAIIPTVTISAEHRGYTWASAARYPDSDGVERWSSNTTLHIDRVVLTVTIVPMSSHASPTPGFADSSVLGIDLSACPRGGITHAPAG
jgi:hypothetical protein